MAITLSAFSVRSAPLEIGSFGTSPGFADRPVVQQSLAGISLFEELVRRQCGIFLELAPRAPVLIPAPSRESSFSPDRFDHPEGGAAEFPFTGYQRPLFHFLERYAHELGDRPPVVLLFLENLSRDFAFALPRVQFPRAPVSKEWASVIARLVNTILVDAGLESGASSHPRRVLAHELGHLFIQDDPPHSCPTARGPGACPADNLMRDFVRIGAGVPRGPGHSFGPGAPPEMPPDDPLEGRELPATGTALNALQCVAIQKTWREVTGAPSRR